jgi:hypothetical protein
MPRRPTVGRAAAGSLLILRHVRSGVHAAHLPHEVFGVVTFVGGYRNSLGTFKSLGPQHRRVLLRRTIALQQFGIYHQPMPVFDDDIAALRQFRFMPATLPASRESGSVVDSCASLLRFCGH